MPNSEWYMSTPAEDLKARADVVLHRLRTNQPVLPEHLIELIQRLIAAF